MKKSDLKRIIREEIQKLNEAQLVSSESGTFIMGPPLHDPPKKYHTKCTYGDGSQILYTNNPPCPDSPNGAAPGDLFIPGPSSDFKRPNKKVKDPNYLGRPLSGGSDSQPGYGGQVSYNCVNSVCQPVQGLGGDFMSLAECQASGCEPNPDDFSGGVGHPGGPGKSGKRKLREQNINDTWDGSCGSIITHYVGDDLKSLCMKCDLGIGGPGSYEQNMDPSPCDCTVPYAGEMISLQDWCRAKFPNLGLGLGTDTNDPTVGDDLSYAIPAEPEKGPKTGIPVKPEDDGKLPFSILKRAGIKPKPRAPRRRRRR